MTQIKIAEFCNKYGYTEHQIRTVTRSGKLGRIDKGVLDEEEALQVMKDLKQKCFKYNGNFSLLWHNSHFKTKDDKKMFEDIVNA